MIITDIVKQRNNEKRFSIFIDNNFCFGISDVDVLYYKLKVGDEISETNYNYILENVILSKAKERAFNYISKRQRSEKEVYDKLKEEYSDFVIDQVIDMLKQYKYIDDKNFALLYTKDNINLKNDGKLKIKYNLKQKGISDKIIDEVFTELDFDETEKINHIINKKIGDKLDLKQKHKLFNYLQSKGFEYDAIINCLNQFFNK